MTTVPIPATTPVSDADVQDFADMSAALTGFQSDVLKPQLDPTGLSNIYYQFASGQIGKDAMKQLLDAYRALKGQPPQQIANTLLEIPLPQGQTQPSTQAYNCQSIVAMWYLGSWYVPSVLGANGFPPPALQVISSVAYTNGLVWRAMQSHPMGYSPFVFGYWSQQPASLSSFGVDTGSGSSSGNGGAQ